MWHTQVVHLLRALVTAKVQTREALLKKMKTAPEFLSEEIQQFLALEARKDFRRLWTALKGSTAWTNSQHLHLHFDSFFITECIAIRLSLNSVSWQWVDPK